MNLYNDNDPCVCAWLSELIAARQLPPGDVNSTTIHELHHANLAAYTQVHLFAGIGGWPHALKLAGWPDDLPVWTGSCPCQPFSCAGKGAGASDPRHHWPVMRDLIAQHRPPVVFGEQVASAAGRVWLAGVRADLEALGYAVGASDLCAAGVGAPHIRQRLYWVANLRGAGLEKLRVEPARQECATAERGCEACGVANASKERREWWKNAQRPTGEGASKRCEGLPDTQCGSELVFWTEHDCLPCLDGKARRIEPGSFPLAHGVPGRVGLLRGYGNAIVPQVAAEFIGAFLDTLN